MAEHGIVGRGILLDFHSWREAQDPPIPYDPFKTGSIPLKYLKATAEAQGTTIKFGDILIIRSGQSKLCHLLPIKQPGNSSLMTNRLYGGIEQEI
jgi:hypothetical protein